MAGEDARKNDANGMRTRAFYGWGIAALVLALLVPVAMVIAAPALATIPSSSSPGSVPALPVPEPGAIAQLDTLYDRLPVVAPGAGRAVYETARLRDAASVGRMFTDAWGSLTAPGADAGSLRSMEGLLLSGQAGQQDPTASNTPFARLAAQVMPDLAADQANAERLSNAAAALYCFGWANLYGTPAPIVDGFRTPDPGNGEFFFPNGAAALLIQTLKVFPTSRDAAINLAFTRDDLAGSLLRRVLSGNPRDVTARLLLSSILARGSLAAPNPDASLAIVRPLLSDPHASAIGYAAQGDVYLTSAFLQQDTARFSARLSAQRALDSYDRALRLTTDPGVYSGRAAALDFLGHPGQAAATEMEAATQAPNTIGPWVLLSYLQEEAGDVPGMSRSAHRALALASPGWNPALPDVTFQLFPWTAREGTSGFLHLSYATDVDVFPIPPQGGGFLEVLDVIPRTDQLELATLRDSSSSGQAVQAALAADIAAGDPKTAKRDARAWQAHAVSSEPGDETSSISALVAAAGLVARTSAKQVNVALPIAQAILRDAGRFHQALQLCRRLVGVAGVQATAAQCAGESQYFIALQDRSPMDRLRDYRGALAELLSGYRAANAGAEGDPDALRLEAAAAASSAAEEERAQGHPAAAVADVAQARRLLKTETRQSAASGHDVLAWAKLGDLAYQQGDLGGAIAAYTATVAAVRHDYPQGAPDSAALIGEQIAYNNRGISELTLAQTDPQTKPDCSAKHELCDAAARDFGQALALDRANPVALLNAGWVARLQGREEEAVRFLGSATLIDPSLYPAFNDLGVLSAEAGDTTAARRDFEAALAADPSYDLAAWNLGVLDTREGLGSTAEGQAYLARAIGENRNLRSSELDYKTDERIYRYLVGADVPHGQALDRGYSVAAVALGWIALLGALYQVAKHLLTDAAQERLAEFWDERIPEFRESLVKKARRLLRRMKPAGAGTDTAEPAPTPERENRRRNAWLLVVPALVAITVFLAWRSSPDAVLPAAALTLLAASIALVTHEAGHYLVAWRVKARVTPEHWGSSIPLAVFVALIPVESNMGPFMGHRVEGEESEKHHHWVYLGGPAANVIMAALAYLLFLIEPLPFLRLLTAVQLAVCAYALLPVKPLDGGELEEHSRILLPFTVALAAATLALVVGLL